MIRRNVGSTTKYHGDPHGGGHPGGGHPGGGHPGGSAQHAKTTYTETHYAEAMEMARICAFLANSLSSPPDDSMIKSLTEMATKAGITWSATDPETTPERDYLDLFVIPNPRYVAPYESYYLDRSVIPEAINSTGKSKNDRKASSAKGLLMGESTLAVRKKQLEAGLEPLKDLPDHISNELWFLAHLWKKEAEAVRSELPQRTKGRQDFSREHLQVWIDKLAENVRQNERTGLYGAVLELASQVVRID